MSGAQMHRGGRWASACEDDLGGRALASPLDGFGRLWRKRYELVLRSSTWTPEQVLAVWKEEFASFWPRMATFSSPEGPVSAGQSARIHLGVGPLTLLSTGVLVLFEDAGSFTFMTPEGHALAGWITFGVDVVDDTPVASIEVLFRTSDPVFDVLMGLGGHHVEDWQWRTVLRALGDRVGAQTRAGTVVRECVDRRRQWHRARNVRVNGLLTTAKALLPRRFPVASPA